MIVDHDTFLSKGARLLRSLGLGEEIEQKMITHFDERYLYHLQQLTELLIKERIPVNIGLPYCYWVLDKAINAPSCTWPEDEDLAMCKTLFSSKVEELDILMNSPLILVRYKNEISRLTEKVNLIISPAKSKRTYK